MTAIVVVGTQFGDEGKGKVVDFISDKKKIGLVVRFQGGNNAGHTVVVGDDKFKLHHIPSGVISGKEVLMGNGMVIDPSALIEELEMLRSKGIEVDLTISDRAHIILNYNRLLDGIEEKNKSSKVGTTQRGIGPTYSDKISRAGVRFSDLLDEDTLEDNVMNAVKHKKALVENVYNSTCEFNEDAVLKECQKYREVLGKYIGNVSSKVKDALENKKNVLFEGAQGTFLDIDFGTYPFVTSSNTTAGAACTGSGIGPTAIDEVIGVVKAYTTRVGEGPFPTELNDEVGKHLGERGHEFGTTTGRPRRCGWLDGIMLRYASRVNSLTSLAVTKLDVLSGLDKIKVCESYVFRGEGIEDFPPNVRHLAECKPVYEVYEGWSDLDEEDWIRVAEKGYKALPTEARVYLSKIEKITGVPVSIVGVGPDRRATIYRK